MKSYIPRSTVIRTLLFLDEGARLLVWDNKYFLLSAPPARLTSKIISALNDESWISLPQKISDDLAEYKITEEGRTFASYLRRQEQSPKSAFGGNGTNSSGRSLAKN